MKNIRKKVWYAVPAILAAALLAILPNVRKETPPQTSAVVCRVGDETALFCENADRRIAPASLTKLLTASAALHYIGSDEVLTVGTEQELLPQGSSVCLISEGQRLTLYDLITGMLMVSGNDAAYTVAVSTARSVNGGDLSDDEAIEYFCGLMNEFAESLGMKNSRFTTPDGSDSAGQYTTANDLRILAEYALSVPEIREIVSVQQRYVVFESGENITWTNSNRLLDPDDEFYCEAAVGLKTGTTPSAGCCLIAAFETNGGTYISVVTGCDSDSERYSVTLEYYGKYVKATPHN
ncbi:MAG: D-alanyl-D-alanine carboxypeptidase [Ruminococcaceae bacterium]|nr:D-alanyl-D-alanine carboxypeptidase [Oscillospiraceae bacterium]